MSVTPASRTAGIPASGSVTVGFTAGKGAADTAPRASTLDGTSCATA